MLHDVFEFDYVSFKKIIRPIVQAIDVHDFGPLYETSRRTIENLSGEWILEDRGTMLEPAEILIDPSSDIEIGYWLLVIMSAYLRRAEPALTGPAWLQHGLSIVGWSKEDVETLIYGETTAPLIKQDLIPPYPRPYSGKDEYWNWVRPTQSNQAGWLSMERLAEFRLRLVAAKPLLQRIEPVMASGPTFNGLTRAKVLEAYEINLKSFDTAIEHGADFSSFIRSLSSLI
jgi:hypothetical protein